jgi:AcrR family transcriptional regulator
VSQTAPRGPGRPRASSREEIERAAIELFLEHGYDEVTAERIASACGVGRATFFRYFDSKADVVFYAFDAYLAAMRTSLESAGPRRSVSRAVTDCVVESTRAAVTNPTWLRRFVLLDTSPGLRANTAEHWNSWSAVLREWLDQRLGAPQQPDEALRRAAFTAAVREIYIEMLRRPDNDEDDPERFVRELESELRPLGRSLARLLNSR